MNNRKNKKYAHFLSFVLSFSSLIPPAFGMDWSLVFNPADQKDQALGTVGTRVLSFLDDRSLRKPAQVSRGWNRLVREAPLYRLTRILQDLTHAEPDTLTPLISSLKDAPFFDEIFLKSQSFKILPKDLLDETTREDFILAPHAAHPYLKTFTEVVKKLQASPHDNRDLKKLAQKYHKILQSLLGQHTELLISPQTLYQQAWAEIDSPSEETKNLISSIENLAHIKDIFPTIKVYRCYSDEIVQLLKQSWNRPSSAAFFLNPIDQVLEKLHNILEQNRDTQFELPLNALIQYYKTFKEKVLRLSPKDCARSLKRSRLKTDTAEPWLMDKKTLEDIFSISSTGDLIHGELTLGSSWVKAYPATHPQVYFKYYNFKDFLDYRKSSAFHPGLERGIYSLSQILGTGGVTPSLFLIVTKNVKIPDLSEPTLRKKRNLANRAIGEPERKRIEKELEDFSWKPHRYGVQVTPAAQGESLISSLEKDLTFKLDAKSYSRQILFGLLAKPADYKEDNLFVNDRGEIIGIDNDEALASMMAKTERGIFTEFKNLLFCLPQMATSVHQDVVASFQDLVPEVVVMEWLGALRHQNNRYVELLKDQDIPPDLQTALHLPLKLHTQTLPQMLNDLRRIKGLLKDNLTHQQLFEGMFPETAAYYRELVEKHGILKAWKTIYGGAAHQGNGLPFKAVIPSIEQALDKTALPQMNDYRHRTLSPEEAARAILGEIDLMTLSPHDLNRLLTTTIKNFADVIKASPASSLHESWSRDGLILKAIAAKVSEPLLTFLLERGLDGSKADTEGKTAFHYIIEHLAPTSFLNLLHTHYKGKDVFAWLNGEDKDGLTALDLAMKNQQLEHVKTLIDLGASDCDPEIVLAFYKDIMGSQIGTALAEAFTTLMKRNDAVRWQVCLQTMLPPHEEGQYGTPLLTAKSGQRLLPNWVKAQILTPDNQWIPYTENGNHIVCRATHQAFGIEHSLYFKIYPELPGIEEAVGSLTRKILGFGAPHTELANMNGVPVLISHSHGDKTKTLDHVLRYNPELLKDLDEESLSGLILVAMLINPEDGKPSNYVIEPHPTKPGKYRIVGIDNDHAFVPAIVREKPEKELISRKTIPIAQVKTILYCLDQMKKPIPSSIRDLFIKLVPNTLLEEWLQRLKTCHESYDQALFPDPHTSPEEKVKFLNDLVNQHGCVIGVPFQKGDKAHKGPIAHLYDKFVVLRDALNRPPITHIELLRKLEPRLAKRYDLALDQLPTAKQRWDQGDAFFYETHKNGSQTTITRTGDVLKSMNIPEKESLLESIRKGNANGPDQALEELKKIKEELETKALEELGARSGDLNILKTLQLESTRAKFLKKKDFKEVPLREQEAVLSYLKDKTLRKLYLKNCMTLNDAVLNQGLSLEHLIKCDLRGCENITSQGLLHLSQTALELEELNLSHIKSLKEIGDIGIVTDTPLIFNKLKFLILSNSVNLVKLFVQAPELHYLNIEDCSLLTDPMLDGVIEGSPDLQNLTVEGCSLIEAKGMRGQFPNYALAGWENITGKKALLDILKSSGIYLTIRDLDVTLQGLLFFGRALKINKNLTNLTELYLNNSIWYGNNHPIGDAGAQSLANGNLINLTSLHLSENNIADLGAQSLATGNFIKLKCLGLRENSIGDAGAQSLATGTLTALTMLDLERNNIGVTGAQSLAIGNLINLTKLYLNDNNIGDVGAQSLATGNLSNLRELYLNDNNIGASGAQSLVTGNLSNLRELYLNNNNIGASGAHSLAHGNLTNLTALYLQWNKKIGDVGAQSLAAGNLTNLRTLDLHWNNIGDAGARDLSRENLTNLTTLDLGGNNIGYRGALNLASGNLTNLAALHLAGNNIGDSGARSLAHGNLTNLTELDLTNNKIAAAGAQTLASGKLTLTELHLNNSLIWLADGNLTNLTTLKLGSNNIGAKAREALRKHYPNAKIEF